MGASRNFKLVTAILETILAIPFIGGLIVLGSGWSMLGIMLILHILSVIFASKEKKVMTGNIVGIVASAVGWIPFVGYILHTVAMILLWIEFAKKR